MALESLDTRGIDDRRAGASKIVDGLHEHLHDLGIGRVAFVGLAQHADARATQPVAHERGRVVFPRRPRAAAVAGSSGSSPTITWKTATASSTVRAIGPAMSASRFSGMTPARLVNPIVERMPASA